MKERDTAEFTVIGTLKMGAKGFELPKGIVAPASEPKDSHLDSHLAFALNGGAYGRDSKRRTKAVWRLFMTSPAMPGFYTQFNFKPGDRHQHFTRPLAIFEQLRVKLQQDPEIRKLTLFISRRGSDLQVRRIEFT